MKAASATEIWEAALGELQLQVSKPNYRTWLKDAVGLSFEGNWFVVSVPNAFVAEYLERNLRSLIEKTLISVTRREDVRVEFCVNGRHGKTPAGQADPPSAALIDIPRLNPKYTFDSFVVSKCNQLAHAAASGVASDPGHAYNPLFIYGGSGLGKTHLLHAISHVAQKSLDRVICTSAEQFTNEFLRAVREKKTEDFRGKYRNADILLIDDVQFICGKERTEECLFHTFNARHNASRQIVFTCNYPPGDLTVTEDRLRSRFEWGLTARIQPPDLKTRLAILEAKANQEGMAVSPDVLELIAQKIKQNIRELEGSLNRVVAYANLLHAVVSRDLAAEALADIADRQPKSTPPTPKLITSIVAECFGLDPANLRNRCRDRRSTTARQTAMYLIREETEYSLGQIGRELGGREPITVSQAHKKIAGIISTDLDFRQRVLDIQELVYQRQKSEP